MKIWRITLVSPSDVAAEKATISSIILELNRRFEGSRIPVQLKTYQFETDVPPGLHGKGPQGLADKYLPIEDSEYVIGIFWKRFGTPTLGSKSGTEHELNKACQAFTEKGKPDVMLYFKIEPFWPETPEETDQCKQVMLFKKEFSGVYRTFNDIQSFKEMISGDLWQSINDRLSSDLPEDDGIRPEKLMSAVCIGPIKLRDRGITELISPIEIQLSSPSNPKALQAQSRYSFLISFNTNFTGQLQPCLKNIVLLRLTYSDGNTVLVPAEMIGPSEIKLTSVLIDFPVGVTTQTLTIGNLRVNASALGTGGRVFANIVLLNSSGKQLDSAIVECGSIVSSLAVGVSAGMTSSYIKSPISLVRSQLHSSAGVSDYESKKNLTFYLSFAEASADVFRSRERESDSLYQWVTQGTRLQATFVLIPGTSLFVTIYSLEVGVSGLTSHAGGARLIASGGPESRRLWNNPFSTTDKNVAIQRLQVQEDSGTAVAVWEWFGTAASEDQLRRATFGIMVAIEEESGFGVISVTGDLGPISTVITAASDPIPRFVPAGSIIEALIVEKGQKARIVPDNAG
jgi:hypothetical protein